MNQDETLLSTNAGSEWMNQAIPGDTPAYWMTALTNNRRTDRNPPHRVPFVNIGRGAFYAIKDLQAFAEFEKCRRIGEMKLSPRMAEVIQAFGIGTATGSSTGKKFNVQSIMPQVDEATGKPFIQMMTVGPLAVYRLELKEAQAIAKELGEAIAFCERNSK